MPVGLVGVRGAAVVLAFGTTAGGTCGEVGRMGNRPASTNTSASSLSVASLAAGDEGSGALLALEELATAEPIAVAGATVSIGARTGSDSDEVTGEDANGVPDRMATKAQILKSRREPKFSTRLRRRCQLCGRPRAVYRKFGICRICFRLMALKGLLPGVTKASW